MGRRAGVNGGHLSPDGRSVRRRERTGVRDSIIMPPCTKAPSSVNNACEGLCHRLAFQKSYECAAIPARRKAGLFSSFSPGRVKKENFRVPAARQSRTTCNGEFACKFFSLPRMKVLKELFSRYFLNFFF